MKCKHCCWREDFEFDVCPNCGEKMTNKWKILKSWLEASFPDEQITFSKVFELFHELKERREKDILKSKHLFTNDKLYGWTEKTGFITDSSMPENEVSFRQEGKEVGRITNLFFDGTEPHPLGGGVEENKCKICGSEIDAYGCTGFDVHDYAVEKMNKSSIRHPFEIPSTKK